MVLALTWRVLLNIYNDELICNLEKVGTIEYDEKPLVRLVRVLVEGEHVESTVRVLRKGFKRFGKEEMVDGVDQ
ncbi:hypothetical protein H5410_003429 [Solanum commersonii]|uniref:Uncharacterized protein n=1 Tax=Solanum commersonii TaxID=4109 RepID=A0A9J6B502_SOLCO|nr:hypothetical protein H5410_003429 [Solanum commersonii]